MQYLKHHRPLKEIPIFERFPVLISVSIIWIYAIILTAGGAYKHRPERTQDSCRTDRANLISSAPWYVKLLLMWCSWSEGSHPWCRSHFSFFPRFKFPYPLQWGPPTFDAGHSVAMMAAVLVSLVEVLLNIFSLMPVSSWLWEESSAPLLLDLWGWMELD